MYIPYWFVPVLLPVFFFDQLLCRSITTSRSACRISHGELAFLVDFSLACFWWMFPPFLSWRMEMLVSSMATSSGSVCVYSTSFKCSHLVFLISPYFDVFSLVGIGSHSRVVCLWICISLCYLRFCFCLCIFFSYSTFSLFLRASCFHFWWVSYFLIFLRQVYLFVLFSF